MKKKFPKPNSHVNSSIYNKPNYVIAPNSPPKSIAQICFKNIKEYESYLLSLKNDQQYKEVSERLSSQICFFGNFLKKSKKYFERHDVIKPNFDNLLPSIFKIVLYHYLFYCHKQFNEHYIPFETFASKLKEQFKNEYDIFQTIIGVPNPIGVLDTIFLIKPIKQFFEYLSMRSLSAKINKKGNYKNINSINSFLNNFLIVANLFSVEFNILTDENIEQFHISKNEILMKIKVFIDLNPNILLYQFIEETTFSPNGNQNSPKNDERTNEENLNKISLIIALLNKATNLDISRNLQYIDDIVLNLYNPLSNSITKSSLATDLKNRIVQKFKNLNLNEEKRCIKCNQEISEGFFLPCEGSNINICFNCRITFWRTNYLYMYANSCCLLCGVIISTDPSHFNIYNSLTPEKNKLGIKSCLKCGKDDEIYNLSNLCKNNYHLIHKSCIKEMMNELKEKNLTINFLTCPKCKQRLDDQSIQNIDYTLFQHLSRTNLLFNDVCLLSPCAVGKSIYIKNKSPFKEKREGESSKLFIKLSCLRNYLRPNTRNQVEQWQKSITSKLNPGLIDFFKKWYV